MTALVLLTLYLALTAYLSLRPLAVLWVSPANVEPLATIRAELRRGPEVALPALGAGMLRLAPLGVLLPLLGRRLGGPRLASLCRTVFAGAMIALAIEFCQSLVPSRTADVDTAILNALGIAVAHQLGYGLLRSRLLRGPAAPTPGPESARARRRSAPPTSSASSAARRAAPAPAPRPGRRRARAERELAMASSRA
ncbi:VanZ family protein [Streptomyces millisiae]|uniref:VanZ family protein n=1 Tax=Streptomyces millisiae TaxID=3075542 RepID=A0ABU2LP28_9ACTN|nr:VanZ family protein [Streptomyces sp. DSM 44918]MDT0319344.1 VanZ family protein [Streptomyces sp. DSM 44918]